MLTINGIPYTNATVVITTNDQPAPPPVLAPAPIVTPIPVPPVAPTGHPTVLGTFDWKPVSELRNQTFGANDILAVSFTTGQIQATPCKIQVAEFGGATPTRLLAINKSEADFSVSPIVGIYNSSIGKQAEVDFTVGPNGFGMLALDPNTTYFANMKNQDGDGGYVINLSTQ